MGVHTEVLSNAEIIKKSNGFKTIVILGCGACANESLAYLKTSIISKKIPDYEGINHRIPYAVTCEMQRIAGVLRKNGHDVKILTINVYGEKTLCVLDDNDLITLKNVIPLGDVIFALCCPSGEMGIRQILGNSISIISIVRVIGTLYCHFDEDIETQKIVKKKCSVIPFSNEKMEVK